MPASQARRFPRMVLGMVVAGIVLFAAISAVILTQPEAPASSLYLPAGKTIILQPSGEGYAVAYNFSWGWGAYLEGSWRATANTTVLLMPRLNCLYCPIMRLLYVSGTEGTLNVTFGGVGWEYTNMTLTFRSAEPDAVRVARTIQVVYPPMTVLYPAGTILSGTGLQARAFDVRPSGAFLVGAWSAVNTTLIAYDGTPQESPYCVAWPPNAPAMGYQDSLNDFLMPGPHGVGVSQCSSRPWTVTVTATIGIFYP